MRRPSVSGLSDSKWALLRIWLSWQLKMLCKWGPLQWWLLLYHSYYSVHMPPSCNNSWLLHSSYPSLSPSCHRCDWNATNLALRLSGWAKLAEAEEMFVYLRANGFEVWKWKHPSFHTLEKGGCMWWGQCLAICEWRQDTDTSCLQDPQTPWLHRRELKQFLWGGCGI